MKIGVLVGDSQILSATGGNSGSPVVYQKLLEIQKPFLEKVSGRRRQRLMADLDYRQESIPSLI